MVFGGLRKCLFRGEGEGEAKGRWVMGDFSFDGMGWWLSRRKGSSAVKGKGLSFSSLPSSLLSADVVLLPDPASPLLLSAGSIPRELGSLTNLTRLTMSGKLRGDHRREGEWRG